jgi:hypothetical protein
MSRSQLRFTLVALTIMLAARQVSGQTRFEWPAASIDIGHYASVEECLTLTGRVRDSVERSDVIWRDTLALTPAEAMAPLPAAVTQAAQQCGARFAEHTVPLENFAPMLSLYLLGGRDADAAALVTRRLHAIAPNAMRERAGVLDTAVQEYLGNPGGFQGRASLAPRPPRLVAAEPLIDELVKLAATTWQERLSSYMRLDIMARYTGDTARARRAADAYLAIARTLTPAERRNGGFGSYTIYALVRELKEAELLDSLRHGTAAYVAFQRATWASTTGERPEAIIFPVGNHAPPIEADFWFRRGDANAPRPTKGKVALIAFIDQSCLQTWSGSDCWPLYMPLKRLAQRFPELEITLVANTHGYLSEMTPPPPAVEADSLAHWWLEERQLPGALAVTDTRFWRLPNPDRRRVDKDLPNVLHYHYDGWDLKAGAMFLVDRGGTIIDVGVLGERTDQEAHFITLLSALFQQQTASP